MLPGQPIEHIYCLSSEIQACSFAFLFLEELFQEAHHEFVFLRHVIILTPVGAHVVELVYLFIPSSVR